MHTAPRSRVSQAFAGVFILSALTAGCSPINWERDYQTGLQRSIETRQRAVLLFTSAFDSGSAAMDAEAFEDKHVQELMRRFVPIRLDVVVNKRLADQLNVQSTPAFFIIRPDTSIAGAHIGVMDADQFRRFLIKYSLN